MHPALSVLPARQGSQASGDFPESPSPAGSRARLPALSPCPTQGPALTASSLLRRLPERVLRSRRQLRLLPARPPVLAGSDASRPALRAVVRPFRDTPGWPGAPAARPPPVERGSAVHRHPGASSRGLAQPRAQPARASPLNVGRGLRAQPTLLVAVGQRRGELRKPPVSPPRNERGGRVVAESRTIRGVRGCTETNLYLRKTEKKKKKKNIKASHPPHFLQLGGSFSVWGDRMGKGDTK